jgi:glycine cleavage system H lipoate-binding protein
MAEPLNKCVWMWAGLLTYRLCDRAYECTSCPVERLFHPGSAGEPRQMRGPESAGRKDPAAMDAAPDRFHDPQHLWLRVLPNGRAQMGFDPMAARLLGNATEIKLPQAGVRLRKGDPAVAVRVKQGEIRFQSPISGVVERVHRIAHSRIALALSRPYSRAWMLVVKAPRLEERLHEFLVGREARLHLAQDWNHFREDSLRLAGGDLTAQPALPDGGDLDLNQLEQIGSTPYFTLLCRWVGDGRVDVLGPGRTAGRARTNETGRTGGPSA